MASKVPVKCLYCNESFRREEVEFVKVKNRYAHKKCFEEKQKQEEKENQDKNELFDYIQEIFGETANYPLINKQLKNYIAQGYSYLGIKKTLLYWYNVKKEKTEKANGGLGIIPYIYQDALTYWRGIWEAQQNNHKEMEKQQTINELEKIKYYISPPKREPHRKNNNSFSFLDKGE